MEKIFQSCRGRNNLYEIIVVIKTTLAYFLLFKYADTHIRDFQISNKSKRFNLSGGKS